MPAIRDPPRETLAWSVRPAYNDRVRVAPLDSFHGDAVMLRWALIFLIVALLAGVFGFWGLEGTAMQIARILFLVFLVLFVISLVTGRRSPIE